MKQCFEQQDIILTVFFRGDLRILVLMWAQTAIQAWADVV